MISRLADHWDVVTIAVGAATIAFFAFSIDDRVSDMQALDEDWLQLDQAQTADVIALIEEVRTTQGLILGRLDGAGAELIYQVGVRDGRALACEVAP